MCHNAPIDQVACWRPLCNGAEAGLEPATYKSQVTFCEINGAFNQLYCVDHLAPAVLHQNHFTFLIVGIVSVYFVELVILVDKFVVLLLWQHLPSCVLVRYVHHGIHYANTVPVYPLPEIPAVITPSSALMVNSHHLILCFSFSRDL